jgi:hypothetical protein
MNLKLVTALLSVGIAFLVAGTAVVATLPSSAKVAAHASAPATRSATSPPPVSESSSTVPPNPTTSSVPSTEPVSTTSSPPTTAVPPSTAFVLTTITYEVKAGDTPASIAKWFDNNGYGRQFGANEQVINANKQLLVPGALITIANGVMTIQSPERG